MSTRAKTVVGVDLAPTGGDMSACVVADVHSDGRVFVRDFVFSSDREAVHGYAHFERMKHDLVYFAHHALPGAFHGENEP